VTIRKLTFGEITDIASRRTDTIFLAGGTPLNSYNKEVFSEYFRSLRQIRLASYSDSKGFLSLRETYINRVLSEKHKPSSLDNIIITVGASAGLFTTLKALVKSRTDEIIILSPCWSQYVDAVVSCGATPILVETSAQQKWQYKLEQIKNKVGQKTKAILYGDPANPTGIVPRIELKNDLVEYARTRNIVIVADETYKGLEYLPIIRSSIMDIDGWEEVAVCIRSMSKYFRSPGIRIGFCLSSTSIIERINRIAISCYLSPSSLDQCYAELLLKNNSSMNWHMGSCYENRKYILEWADRMKEFCYIVEPDAAYFVFLKLLDQHKKPLDAIELFEKTGVLARPGNSFGPSGKQFMRICIDVKRSLLEEAMNRIENTYYDFD
jgi:aspartate/methionine/tyrosine aminotransferase